jgi:sugar transferase EpsL
VLKGERRGVATRRARLKLKRCFDLALTVPAVVALSPLFCLVWVSVRVQIGKPVLFRQVRLGLGGEPFELLKFRSMTDAVDEAGELLPDEARLTPLGRWLRRTSVDELPELLNVIRGEMSLVGPRPLLPEYRELYTAEQWRRHEVLPGIAGPVVSRGRNALRWEDKFRWDVWYVDNWSLALDAVILIRSLWCAVTGEGTQAEGHATMPLYQGPEGRG